MKKEGGYRTKESHGGYRSEGREVRRVKGEGNMREEKKGWK